VARGALVVGMRNAISCISTYTSKAYKGYETNTLCLTMKREPSWMGRSLYRRDEFSILRLFVSLKFLFTPKIV
jgi:hypothetical protein